MLYALPTACQGLIQAYAGLDFGHQRLVPVPYYKNNPRLRRLSTPVDAGKGAPHDLVEETKARALERRVLFDQLTADGVRSFMIKEGIGIDCSGFAARVLDLLLRDRLSRSIADVITPAANSWWRAFLFRFRPFQNIDVRTLTDTRNAQMIPLSSLAPGDLIRTRGGNHVLLVTETERDEQGVLQSFRYWHSSGQFGDDSGIREGRVIISDPAKDLAEQEWKELWQGKAISRDGWMEERGKNGLFRLKALITQNSNVKSQNHISKP